MPYGKHPLAVSKSVWENCFKNKDVEDGSAWS
jgi:hypothetical protein